MSKAAQVKCPHCQTRAVPLWKQVGRRLVQACRACGVPFKVDKGAKRG